MVYCVYTDVVSEFKKLDITGGIITQAKITEWITQADGYINGRLYTKYVVPITATSSLPILKQVSIGLVAQRIARILEVKSMTQSGDQYIPKDLIKEAKETLTMLADGSMVLIDATDATNSSGVSSYTSDNTVTRSFDVTKDQW